MSQLLSLIIIIQMLVTYIVLDKDNRIFGDLYDSSIPQLIKYREIDMYNIIDKYDIKIDMR